MNKGINKIQVKNNFLNQQLFALFVINSYQVFNIKQSNWS